jgi:hypothetical protein
MRRFWIRDRTSMYRVRYPDGGYAYFPGTKHLAIEHAAENGGRVEQLCGRWVATEESNE